MSLVAASPLRGAFVGAVFIPLLSCTTPTGGGGEAGAGPAPAPPPAAPAYDPPALAAKLCGGKAGCTLAQAHPAGEGAGGVALTVIELAIANPPEGADGEYVEQCRPHRQQFWKVSQEGGAVKSELLLDLCNDGYGAAGLGEDYVTVSDNRLKHSQSGGSNSRWGFTRTYSLSPLRLLEDDSCAFHAAFGNAQSVKTDWITLRSMSRWDAPACGAEEGEMMDCDTPSLRFQYDLIPRLPPEGPKPADWKGSALGTCAFAMDASGKTGYITHGQPGDASDASMKVMMADARTVVVEVVDDQVVSGAKSWLYDDHVELWVGDDMMSGTCLEGKGKTSQWGIRISDGAVFVGKGGASWQPTVQRVGFDAGGGRQGVRLVLTLGEDTDVLTVVYSDSDDGQTQERLMATSRLKYGDAATLGYTIQLGPAFGACQVGGDTLRWEPRTLEARGDEPALSVL